MDVVAVVGDDKGYIQLPAHLHQGVVYGGELGYVGVAL